MSEREERARGVLGNLDKFLFRYVEDRVEAKNAVQNVALGMFLFESSPSIWAEILSAGGNNIQEDEERAELVARMRANCDQITSFIRQIIEGEIT